MPTMLEMLRAIRESAVASPVKCVLFTLTSLGDPRTGLIPDQYQPSLRELADMAGMSKSTLVVHLATAEKAGWLDRSRPDGEEAVRQNDNTRYQVTVPLSGFRTTPLSGSRTGVVPDPDRGSPRSGQPPVRDPDNPLSGSRNDTFYTGHTGLNSSGHDDLTSQTGQVSDEPDQLALDLPKSPNKPARRSSAHAEVGPDDQKFAEFWTSAYPRRGKAGDSRGKALAVWNKLIELGVDLDAVIAGARRYAASRVGEDPKFTAMASTWLNPKHRNWESEYDQPPGAAPAPRIPVGEQCPRHYGHRADACRLCVEEQTELAKEIAA